MDIVSSTAGKRNNFRKSKDLRTFSVFNPGNWNTDDTNLNASGMVWDELKMRLFLKKISTPEDQRLEFQIRDLIC